MQHASVVPVVRLEVNHRQKPLRVAVTDSKSHLVASMALLLEAALLSPVLALQVVAQVRPLPRLRLVLVVPVPQLEASNHKLHLPALVVAVNPAVLHLLNNKPLSPKEIRLVIKTDGLGTRIR